MTPLRQITAFRDILKRFKNYKNINYYYPKSKQNGKGHDASYPRETLSNKMVRAQFIVPLQHNYYQKAKIYYEFICNTLYNKIFFKLFGE